MAAGIVQHSSTAAAPFEFKLFVRPLENAVGSNFYQKHMQLTSIKVAEK